MYKKKLEKKLCEFINLNNNYKKLDLLKFLKYQAEYYISDSSTL